MLPTQRHESEWTAQATGLPCIVLLHNAIPFVGFGFLDNAIMIAAGTQIELSIGVTFGISTMAAAALGNLVSDLAGLGLAGYVEALAARFGMQIPDLTPKQVDMWQTRLSSHMGKAIGVTIGCLLGMFPLFFLNDEDEEESKDPPITKPTDSNFEKRQQKTMSGSTPVSQEQGSVLYSPVTRLDAPPSLCTPDCSRSLCRWDGYVGEACGGAEVAVLADAEPWGQGGQSGVRGQGWQCSVPRGTGWTQRGERRGGV
ncbi:hypothetical protein NFI96_005945 [Prochilodus magdalenae]|nr:hypothetical protein NFI96_005945 [Prochilodus magdalenae]